VEEDAQTLARFAQGSLARVMEVEPADLLARRERFLEESGGTNVLSSVVAGQDDVHRRFGGIVPELASRAHIESLVPAVEAALEQAGCTLDGISALGVCVGPGLVGSLLVGVSFAKGLARTHRLPLAAVNHLEGHVFGAFLETDPPAFPFIALVVSGGHTSLFDVTGVGRYREIGKTRDDAAGEAYDKVAKLLGLGYPGGPAIDRLAERGNPQGVRLPKPFAGPSPDFSFSGLKTAVMRAVQSAPGSSPNDLAASFQDRVVDVLVEKSFRAARRYGRRRIVLSGGVAANRGLRAAMCRRGDREGIRVFLPSPHYCTDNAAMIAAVAYHHIRNGSVADSRVAARSFYPLRSWLPEASR